MKIENAVPGDVDEVAHLHVHAFPGFFLTSLGPVFLKELYRGFLSHPSGIFLVARNEDGIIGFVAGTSEPEVFFNELRRRRGLFFGLKALPAILGNPLPVVRKLFYALRYRGDAPVARVSGALLSSIGVAGQVKGTGVAGRLVAAFEDEARKRGARSVYLTTDVHANERVNTFYVKHNYRIRDQFKQGGRRDMFRYEKILVPDARTMGEQS